jgi:hypothetical protein
MLPRALAPISMTTPTRVMRSITTPVRCGNRTRQHLESYVDHDHAKHINLIGNRRDTSITECVPEPKKLAVDLRHCGWWHLARLGGPSRAPRSRSDQNERALTNGRISTLPQLHDLSLEQRRERPPSVHLGYPSNGSSPDHPHEQPRSHTSRRKCFLIRSGHASGPIGIVNPLTQGMSQAGPCGSGATRRRFWTVASSSVTSPKNLRFVNQYVQMLDTVHQHRASATFVSVASYPVLSCHRLVATPSSCR